jgi:hypothetical protein
MATAEYKVSRSKKTLKPMATFVRLTMTPEEHRDMLVALNLVCIRFSKPKSKGGQRYLDRLRTLYDNTFEPAEIEAE